MTKRDFQLIAAVLANVTTTDFSKGNEVEVSAAGKRYIADRFADALATTNPRFKRELFIQAATGVVPVTARKAI